MRSLPVMPRAATSAAVRSKLYSICSNTVVSDVIQTAFSSDFRQLMASASGLSRVRLQTAEPTRSAPARVDSGPRGPTLPGVPRGAPVKELRDAPVDTAGTL